MLKEDIVKTLLSHKIATPESIQGCSEEEIRQLEIRIGYKLPKPYREYLLAAGHTAGILFLGTDISFSSLGEISVEAKKLIEEYEKDFILPEDSFVFYMHQGYIFGYFKFSEGDDPPIYEYFEGNGKPNMTWINFNDFFNKSITLTLEYIKNRDKD